MSTKHKIPPPSFAWAKPKFQKPPPLALDVVPMEKHEAVLAENAKLAKRVNELLSEQALAKHWSAPTHIQKHYVGTKETAELHKRLGEAVEIMHDVLRVAYTCAGNSMIGFDPPAIKRAVAFIHEAYQLLELQPGMTATQAYEWQKQVHWSNKPVELNHHLMKALKNEVKDIAADDCSGPNGDHLTNEA